MAKKSATPAKKSVAKKSSKKFPSGISVFLLEMILPAFLRYGRDAAKEALQNAHDESEEGKQMIQTATVAVYPVIDTYIESAVTKTKTHIDDKTVAELKGLCEELAADNGFELPNLDND